MSGMVLNDVTLGLGGIRHSRPSSVCMSHWGQLRIHEPCLRCKVVCDTTKLPYCWTVWNFI